MSAILVSVDVAVVDVAVKFEATTCPTTDSGAYGDEVPMPMRLPERTNVLPEISSAAVLVVETAPIKT